MAKMVHLGHPKKSAIFETFGQNFPIQLIEEGSTLHFKKFCILHFQTIQDSGIFQQFPAFSAKAKAKVGQISGVQTRLT